MFDADQLAYVDPEYFNVILMDPYDVSIQSKNTGHYWLIHSCTFEYLTPMHPGVKSNRRGHRRKAA